MARVSWAIAEHHRELLARETGAVVKEPGGRLSVALVYPNTYQVGMANLGLAVIYRLLNQRPGFLCERAFLPDRRLAGLYRKTGDPLATLESSRPVAGFDLVLATLPFENDAPHLAAMLEHAGLGAAARGRQGPLVVAGGVAAMLNPEPYAEVADGFLLGEAEAVLPGFLEAWRQARELPRSEALLALGREAPGFYPPAWYRPAYGEDGLLASFEPLAAGLPERIPAPKHHGPELAASAVRAPGPEFGDMALIEVGRGCGHGCRFCAAGHVLRPPRPGRAEDFREAAAAAARRAGKVGLVSAAVSDLPGAGGLAQAVVEAGGRVSVSSLRADRLTPELARALAASGAQTVALAPEAGSARLRRVINKHLREEQLARAVEMLIGEGILNLKLYFMVGLPTETEEDVEAVAELAARVRQQVVSLSRAKGRLGRVAVSLNAFVPKAWTPFQWEPMLPPEELKARMGRVRRGLAGLANLKVTTDVPKYALLQGALARGDRRLGPVVRALARGGSPAAAARAAGVELEAHACRPREQGELLPWDFIDHGLDRAYLWAEARRARRAAESPACEPETCRRCGVCGPLGEEP